MNNWFPETKPEAGGPVIEGPPRFDVPPIENWSFSRLLDFEACPYRTLLKHVIKSDGPELPPDHPLVKGRKQHQEAEYYILGTGPMTKNIRKVEETLQFCRDMYEAGSATVEADWAFDATWGSTGWWDEDVWLRVKCDATVRIDTDAMIIYDWKSGKSEGYEVKQMQQAQLYVVAALMLYPEVDTIEVVFGFFKDGKLWRPRQEFTRTKMLRYVKRWTERAGALTNCTEFLPKPNKMNCMLCPFGPGQNGTGACVYGVDQ